MGTMLQADLQTVSVSAADITDIDALFKRIAERGRKIRNQSKSTDSENLVGDTTSAGQGPDPQGDESNHE